MKRKVYQKSRNSLASKFYITALLDECLPIVCAVPKNQKMSLNVESTSRDEVRKGINEVLHGDCLEEFVKLVAENLNNILVVSR